ncbi:MAG: DUF63 family protein [Candidatus Aenigmarchaeota archaeon]|nr:DUF63 family protein [Candidatus Aenigmarchaeota archaeon]MDW8149531.1 DUF63 family protein [Candidatus Aenigmarchaeota archaeon]
MINPIEYFTEPLKEGYTFEKTLVLGIIFLLFVFLIYKILKKLKVKINYLFSLSIFFYILFGASLRVLMDLKILNSILLVTPNIWLIVGSITLLSLLINRKNYKMFLIIGIILSMLPFSLLIPNFKNFYGFSLVFFFILPVIFVLKHVKTSLSNKAIIFSQYFDGIVAYVSVKYFSDKLVEQHLLANILFSYLPELYIFVKLFFGFLVAFLIDREKLTKFQKNYLKLVIAAFGATTSTRSFLLLLSV